MKQLLLIVSLIGINQVCGQPIDMIHNRIQTLETALNNGKVQRVLFADFKNDVKHLQLELSILLFTLEHFEDFTEVSDDEMQTFMRNVHENERAINCFQRWFLERSALVNKLEGQLIPIMQRHESEKMRTTAQKLARQLTSQLEIVDGQLNILIARTMMAKNPRELRCP